MSLCRLTKKLALALALGAGALTGGSQALGGCFGLFGCCCEPCPKYVHCQEGPPRIKMKIGCGKPVCDPCAMPHFGYYQTCWSPWPYPPDWSHCLVPPPGAVLEAHPPVFGPEAGKRIPISFTGDTTANVHATTRVASGDE